MKINLFEGEEVLFIETTSVTDGVICDVYHFLNNDKKDLAIVSVSAGYKTPLQKVLMSEKTLEIFISGSGTLSVNRKNGLKETFNFPKQLEHTILVGIGDVMQWKADRDLVFAEVCHPPYSDGRFEVVKG